MKPLRKFSISASSTIFIGTTSQINQNFFKTSQINTVIGFIDQETYNKYKFNQKTLSYGIKQNHIFWANCNNQVQETTLNKFNQAIDFIVNSFKFGNILIYAQSCNYIGVPLIMGFLIKNFHYSTKQAYTVISKSIKNSYIPQQFNQYLQRVQFQSKLPHDQNIINLPKYPKQFNTNQHVHHIISFKKPLNINHCNLFLGSSFAVNHKYIQQFHFDAILSLLSQQAYDRLSINQICSYSNVSNKFIKILDSQDDSITKHFEACFKFIDENIIDKNVLVHCKAGKNRSASIVIGYLIYKLKVSYKIAYQFVKSKRECIEPNPKFDLELFNFSQNIKKE